jgi:hypothetical protein
MQCAAACTDKPCVDKCLADHPDGLTAAGAVLECGDESCGTECG